MSSARYRLGLVLVVTSSLAWSTAGLFTRLLPLVDGMTMLTWRGIYGALGMLGLGLVLDGRHLASGLKVFLRRDGWPAWLFAACTVGGMICYVSSLLATTVAHVSVIYASVPFVAAALGWIFLAERPSLSALGASLAALVGVAVMVGFGSEGALAGDLLAFGMTLGMAISMVLTRRFRDIPFLPVAIVSALASAFVCWPFGDPFSVTPSQMATLAAFGIVNSAVGFGLFTLGARFLPAVETALVGALDAPLAPLWVFLVFNEVPGPSTIVGGLIVFVAVAIYLVFGAASKPAPDGDVAVLTPQSVPQTTP